MDFEEEKKKLLGDFEKLGYSVSGRDSRLKHPRTKHMDISQEELMVVTGNFHNGLSASEVLYAVAFRRGMDNKQREIKRFLKQFVDT